MYQGGFIFWWKRRLGSPHLSNSPAPYAEFLHSLKGTFMSSVCPISMGQFLKLFIIKRWNHGGVCPASQKLWTTWTEPFGFFYVKVQLHCDPNSTPNHFVLMNQWKLYWICPPFIRSLCDFTYQSWCLNFLDVANESNSCCLWRSNVRAILISVLLFSRYFSLGSPCCTQHL